MFGIGGREKVKSSIFFGAEMRKARAPNDSCHQRMSSVYPVSSRLLLRHL